VNNHDVLSKARLKFLRSLRMKKVRAQEGLLLVEGLNAVHEAVRGGHALELLLTPEARERFPGVDAVEIGAPEAEALAQTRSTLGAFALVRDPCRPLVEAKLGDTALVLLAAGVADPGNLGTLVRTAAAAGADAVVVAAGTVEPTNPKAARATAGALFRIPVLLGEAAQLKELGFALWLADAAGTPVREAGEPPALCALVVGNEPRGADASVARLADKRVAVPLRGGVESLNVAVAAGILLYELAR
jgi:TrmH family RNA methyltransferase